MSLNYCVHCMEPVTPGEQVCPHCGKPNAIQAPVHHLKPGAVLRDKYMVGKALGEGGFGITYIGRDLTLDMRIAVKEYYPHGFSTRNHNYSNGVTLTGTATTADFEKEMKRFLNEARVLARFANEPGIVGVRDFFQENGTAYIVMEFLDGITLKAYLKKYGKFPADTLFSMIDPVLLALGRIHNQGLIHRDISPDNIMMLKTGQLKLLDFGAAREVAGDKSLSVMLKPGYAPEEQYRTKGQQGAWTDVYAMCATIYKCITGVTPDESIQRVFEDELKTPSSLGAAISPRQEAALMHGLKVKSRDRLQSMADLRAALGLSGSDGIRTVHIQQHQAPDATPGDYTLYRGKDEQTLYPPAVSTPAPAEEVPAQPEPPVISESPVVPEPVAVPEAPPVPVPESVAPVQAEVAYTPAQTVKAEEGITLKNPRPLVIAVCAIVVVALIVGGIMLLGGSGKDQTSMSDSLPNNRTITSDCAKVLKDHDDSLHITNTEVESENLSEKFKTYVINCSVTAVDDDGKKESFDIMLYYTYENDEWVITDQSRLK